jgi:hypothetical protein
MSRLEAVSALLHTVLLVWVVLLAGCTITPAYAPPPYATQRMYPPPQSGPSVVVEQPRQTPPVVVHQPEPPAVIYQGEPSYSYPGY